MTDIFDIEGRVALVTGASSGIGRHFARMLAGRGCRVGLAARRLGELESLADEIETAGGYAAPIALDIGETETIPAALDQLETRLGPASLLVNNAGLAFTEAFVDTTPADVERIIGVNLTGNVALARIFAERLAARDAPGSIVNVTSVTSLKVARFISAYCMTKAALLAATRQLALHWGPRGIRVNALAPGYVRTALSEHFFATSAERIRPRIPMRRFLEPCDLDGALLLLLSDAGRAITGANLVVDAGHAIAEAV